MSHEQDSRNFSPRPFPKLILNATLIKCPTDTRGTRALTHVTEFADDYAAGQRCLVRSPLPCFCPRAPSERAWAHRDHGESDNLSTESGHGIAGVPRACRSKDGTRP